MPINNDKSLTVELRAAKIPGIGLVAVHYWFVIYQSRQTERWEVWQLPSQNHSSWQHIHKNLLPFDRGVGNGNSWVETYWQGDEASKLAEVLRNSPSSYPFKARYHYWPGPNSNTYVQWILTQAHIDHQMIPQGIGKNHMGLIGWRKTAAMFEFSTPLFGFRYSRSSYVEVHFLHLALSAQFKPFMLKTFILFGMPSNHN